MLKQNELVHSIRVALVLGLAGSVSMPVMAQDDAAELDAVVITGSRIRQVDAETAQPVQTITRAEIEKQGFQSVADILQNTSAAGSPTISRAQPLSAGEAVGGSYLDLRNLGAQRTLILVNGKRLGITTGGLQDISTIPAALVERVEILKDGASAVYGSDAIAGVVNIITRKGFSGAQASAYVGQFSQGDGEIKKADGVLGVAGEKGSITFGLEYTKEDEVMASDRLFSRFPTGPLHTDLGWTPVGQFGGFVGAVGGGTGTTRLVLRPGGNPRVIGDYVAQNTTGLVNGVVVGQVSNTLEQTSLRSPIEQRSLFLNMDYELSDTVRLVSDVMYTNRLASRQIAGFPLQAAASGTPMSIDSYFNPVGNQSGFATPRAITNWWRRGWEVPRVSDSELNTFRVTAAVEGSFDFADRAFFWDVGVMYNNNSLVQETFGNFNLTNVRLAVGPSFFNAATGRVQCGTAAAPIAFGSGQNSCVPFNPYLPFGTTGDGGLTGNALLQQFLFQAEHATGETATKLASANLTGSIMELPAGELGFAAGIERRMEIGEFIPDALAVTGNSTNLSSLPTEGRYALNEAYAEFNVPLLADVQFAKELTVSIATRYSDFDTFGDTTNSKASLKWRPIDELLLRATVADGFRAPTISNIYAGGSQTFSFYTDPCDTRFGSSATNAQTRARCAADPAIGARAATFRQLQAGFVPGVVAAPQTPLAFFSGAANPNLTPETSASASAGFVWSPSFLNNFNISADFWKVRIADTIIADTPTQILNDCYVEGITSRCSSTLFTRDPVLGIVNTATFGNRNAGFVKTQGFDLDMTYKFETESFGEFAFNSQSTYVDNYETRSTNDNSAFTTKAVGFGGTFRVRSNFNTSWTLGDYGITWGARYSSSIRETCLNATAFPNECNDPTYTATNPAQTRPTNVSGSTTFHDLQFRYSAPWDATIAVGANNVFGHEGPVLYSQPNANVNYYGGFDIGRFVYVKYQQKF